MLFRSQRSALVRSLIQPTETAWLIHPAEVAVDLRQELAVEQQRSAA